MFNRFFNLLIVETHDKLLSSELVELQEGIMCRYLGVASIISMHEEKATV